jgi:hypothetical protein
MPFVPVSNTAMFEIRGVQKDKPVENTLWFRFTPAITTTLMLTVAEALAGLWETSIMPNVSDKVTYTEVYGTDMTTNASPTITLPFPSDTTGTRTGEMLPQNNSLALSFRTAARGKTSRGRNYLIGFTNEMVVENTVIEPFLGNYLTAYAQMIGPGVFVSGAEWVVVSRRVNKAWRAEGLARPVTQILFVNDKVDSQRGRME